MVPQLAGAIVVPRNFCNGLGVFTSPCFLLQIWQTMLAYYDKKLGIA